MKLRIIAFVLFLCGTFCLCAAAAKVLNEQRSLSGKIIRLHVIGASNGAKDQSVKLQVRDSILKRLPQKKWKNREEAEQWFDTHMEELTEYAGEIISENGLAYPVSIHLRSKAYPTREDSVYPLPAGEYLTCEVILGEGNGRNWWGIVYPQLFRGKQSVQSEEAFSEEEKELLQEDTPKVHIKFKLLELLTKKQ